MRRQYIARRLPIALACACLAMPTSAIAQGPGGGRPPPLLRERIATAGPLDATMQYAVLPPGSGSTELAPLAGHRHPGHMLVYVLEGEVLSSLDGGAGVRYGVGATWFERPGQLHRILNLSTTSPARLLVVALDPVAEAR